jgi:hypothetical protein
MRAGARLAIVATILAVSPLTASGASALCGTRPTPPAVWEHVVWIWFENHGYGEIVGSSQAPFTNRTLAAQCGLATNYHAIGHPSLPNYIAATSGLAGDALGRFHNDCNAKGPCRIGAPSLFEQAGSWGAFAESMRRPCTTFFTGLYAASHDPAVYYTTLTDCPSRVLNLRALDAALAADTLPAFVFITPNMCHSMHNCSVRTGDAWLRHTIGRLTASAAWSRGATAILITFDEDDGGDNHVATFVVAPSTPPRTRSGESFTHYSLLRTTEEMLGLSPPLGHAATAKSMRAAFHL